MYTVERIEELDFGCEGRPEGMKDMVRVILKGDNGEEESMKVEDDWLYAHGIDEGSRVYLDEDRKLIRSEEYKMIKAVIFDIDNTLYDYDKNHVYGMKALADYCESAFGVSGEEMKRCYKEAQRIMLDRIRTDTAAIHSRLLRMQIMLELWEKPLFPHALNMYHAYWDTLIRQAQPSPGVQKFMQELKKRGIRIGIGTDMTAYVQYKKLSALGLDSCIDFIVTSEEAGIEKPDPHLFDICVEKAGFSANECAFIGDSLKKDVEGSAKCGLKGIWYTQGKEPEMEAKFPVIKSFENVNIDELLK